MHVNRFIYSYSNIRNCLKITAILMICFLASYCSSYIVPQDWKQVKVKQNESSGIICPSIMVVEVEYGRIDQRPYVNYADPDIKGRRRANWTEYNYSEYLAGGKDELLETYVNWIIAGVKQTSFFENVILMPTTITNTTFNETQNKSVLRLHLDDYFTDSHIFVWRDRIYGRVDMGDKPDYNMFTFLPSASGCGIFALPCWFCGMGLYDLFDMPYHNIFRTTRVSLDLISNESTIPSSIYPVEVSTTTVYPSNEFPVTEFERLIFESQEYFINFGRQLSDKLKERMVESNLCRSTDE